MKRAQFLMVMVGATFFAIANGMSSNMPDAIKNYRIARTSWADIDEISLTEKFLIESLTEIDKNYSKADLLFFASKFDELLPYTEFLLHKGVKPNQSYNNTLPLDNAIENGALQTAYLLAQSGADCRKSLPSLLDRFSYAHDEKTLAVQKSLLNLFVQKGAHVNSPQTMEIISDPIR